MPPTVQQLRHSAASGAWQQYDAPCRRCKVTGKSHLPILTAKIDTVLPRRTDDWTGYRIQIRKTQDFEAQSANPTYSPSKRELNRIRTEMIHAKQSCKIMTIWTAYTTIPSHFTNRYFLGEYPMLRPQSVAEYQRSLHKTGQHLPHGNENWFWLTSICCVCIRRRLSLSSSYDWQQEKRIASPKTKECRASETVEEWADTQNEPKKYGWPVIWLSRGKQAASRYLPRCLFGNLFQHPGLTLSQNNSEINLR
jgi:hypothetical protein